MIYYFIGIKGSGMSSLAQIMHELGYTVTGSDKPDHFFTEVGLIEKGIKVPIKISPICSVNNPELFLKKFMLL